ncbi:hypothetical protein [Microvirga massiliensis]|uniref:hypothetical protein n=1 Tax=Microvirga massiliensis TaxID=1033741 RepID=UPI00062BA6A2|nr:hypothetical protein [Microvirga massiliensis]
MVLSSGQWPRPADRREAAEYDAWFGAEVAARVAEADRGEFIDSDEAFEAVEVAIATAIERR